MDCIFFLGDSCITTNHVLLSVGAVGLVLLIAGIALYRKTNREDEQGGIQVTNMAIQQTIPQAEPVTLEFNNYVEEDSNSNRIPVGKKVFVGEEDGLGAKLEIVRYNEEGSEVICRLWIEAPAGASDIIVDHMVSDKYYLGVAIIQYVYDLMAYTVKIGLQNDDLSDCGYEVVINVAQSTLENLQ